MKVGILAGGRGTRLGHLTAELPKPLVEVGGRPILWHIMRMYAHYGFNEFAVALGYRGADIKRWARDHAALSGDVTILPDGTIRRRIPPGEDWSVHLIETGARTETGGRIKRLGRVLGDDTFMLTWGDGVSDVDLGELLDFHRSHGRLVTVTAVRPPGRFGHLHIDGERVVAFEEKPIEGDGWINGAFFVVEPEALDYVEGDLSSWERGAMAQLARDGQLMAYRHDGFWQCMDTPRDRDTLESLCMQGHAPWCVWDRPFPRILPGRRAAKQPA